MTDHNGYLIKIILGRKYLIADTENPESIANFDQC